MVSLLKAFYGDAATAENEYGYQWLPKRASADAYSHQHMFVDMYKGIIKGFLADGQNPAVGGPNAKLARAALGKLDWLVVKDIFLTETAEFWKAPGVTAKDIKTEVFFLPAAPAAEKDGSLTNTMRLIQWHEKAVNPPGDVTSDAEFFVSLAKRLQKLYAGSKKERDKGFLAASFEYGDNPKEPNMELVLKEINGFATQEITDKDGKVVYKKGQALNTFAHMTDDGKTAGGCWIYTGVTVEGPDGKLINKSNLRKPADDKDYLAHGWGFAWPANRRILYNRASADLAGQALEREEEAHLVGPGGARAESRRRRASGSASTCPTSTRSWPPTPRTATSRSSCGRTWWAPSSARSTTGPFPEHYEPVESPTKNLLSKQQMNPVAKIWSVPDQKNDLAPVGSPDYPYVITTYRLTEHHLSGVMSRYLPMLAELFHSHFAEISHELAARARDRQRRARDRHDPAGQGPRDRDGHPSPQAVHDRRQEDAPDRRARGTGATTASPRATSPTISPPRWETPRSTSRRPRPSSAT